MTTIPHRTAAIFLKRMKRISRRPNRLLQKSETTRPNRSADQTSEVTLGDVKSSNAAITPNRAGLSDDGKYPPITKNNGQKLLASATLPPSKAFKPGTPAGNGTPTQTTGSSSLPTGGSFKTANNSANKTQLPPSTGVTRGKGTDTNKSGGQTAKLSDDKSKAPGLLPLTPQQGSGSTDNSTAKLNSSKGNSSSLSDSKSALPPSRSFRWYPLAILRATEIRCGPSGNVRTPALNLPGKTSGSQSSTNGAKKPASPLQNIPKQSSPATGTANRSANGGGSFSPGGGLANKPQPTPVDSPNKTALGDSTTALVPKSPTQNTSGLNPRGTDGASNRPTVSLADSQPNGNIRRASEPTPIDNVAPSKLPPVQSTSTTAPGRFDRSTNPPAAGNRPGSTLPPALVNRQNSATGATNGQPENSLSNRSGISNGPTTRNPSGMLNSAQSASPTLTSPAQTQTDFHRCYDAAKTGCGTVLKEFNLRRLRWKNGRPVKSRSTVPPNLN